MVLGQPYDYNGHIEVTYGTFCQEPKHVMKANNHTHVKHDKKKLVLYLLNVIKAKCHLFINHFGKFLCIWTLEFLISMNTPPRKEEAYYTYSLNVG
jgi:hypothetical protein